MLAGHATCAGNGTVETDLSSLCTKGKGILHRTATSKVISLGWILHSGCKVHFETGRTGDHQFRGTITHPNGTTVNMIYHKGIWLLPVLTLEKAWALHHKVYSSSINTEMSCISASNLYQVLLDLATDIEPVRESTTPVDMEQVTDVNQLIMQLLHDLWSHPSNSKMECI
eukprot:2668798-Rhodomonas_salina.2